MKPRIQTDTTLLYVVIILTGVMLIVYPKFYPQDQLFDNLIDCLGIIAILKGTLLRMCARGHKKSFSQNSSSLVTTGPYQFSRNPMYLGSFLIGIGFVLLLWPWWLTPVFAIVFYVRFNKQMVAEEKLLTEHFGEQYTKYCQNVSRIFPSIKCWGRVKLRDAVNPKELFSTKETRGLWTWPLVGFVLELVQEWLVFGSIHMISTAVIFIATIIVFFTIGFLEYKLIK